MRRVLRQAFPDIEPLVVLPEHRVPLPGGRRPTQSDVWVLAASGHALVSIAVEGKVSESFGPTVAAWDPRRSPGRRVRFASLQETVGLHDVPPDIRYQLLHRAAAAIIEARRFRASHAVLLVHSFGGRNGSGIAGFDDFAAFVALFGARARPDAIVSAVARHDPDLHFAWAADALPATRR